MLKNVLLIITIFFIFAFIEGIFPSVIARKPGETIFVTLPILLVIEYFLIKRLFK